MLENIANISMEVGLIRKKTKTCHFRLLFLVKDLQLEGISQGINGCVPRKSNQIGVPKDRVLVVLKPIFGFGVSRVTTP